MMTGEKGRDHVEESEEGVIVCDWEIGVPSIDSVTMQGAAHLSVGNFIGSLDGVKDEEEEGVGGGVFSISSATVISVT